MNRALLLLPLLALPPRPRIVASIRLPYTSSSSPAVGDVDGTGRLSVAITSDNIGDKTRDRDDPRNVNAVRLYRWDRGALRPHPGWPQPTRDATLGLALADLDGDGRDEVIGACGQDFASPLMQKSGLWLSSRLYVWRGDGRPFAPWYPATDDGAGIAAGHAYAAPCIADLNGDGRLEILHASQGEWITDRFERGSMRLWSPNGRILARTQGDTDRLPWRTLPGFAMDAPPVTADLDGDGRLEVIAATFTGKVYAWDNRGNDVPGWFPSARAETQTRNNALLRGAIAAADIDGRLGDEVMGGGYDGAMYAWTRGGKLLWRALANPALPAPLTSGVAVGRLRRGNRPERDIVAGDQAGWVTVWRPNGSVFWRSPTTPGMPVEAEPSIGDVNGDGSQDVVVGGTDGYVYAFDGETGALLWQVPMPAAPTLEGMRLESIFGAPALCNLRGDGHMIVVVPTAQRYIVDTPTHQWQGFGRLIALDCGPNTFHADRLDWPQYRHDRMRSGRLGASLARPGDKKHVQNSARPRGGRRAGLRSAR
ncbi:MAG TPA: PQQ-binding-like beta-propeller repeat protein [Armatimonadota bacterium]|jgi:outer membrane protein assembly factor BamB